jgi:hypothetical protein
MHDVVHALVTSLTDIINGRNILAIILAIDKFEDIDCCTSLPISPGM